MADYSVVKNENGGYTVKIDGKVCDNAKEGMRQISEAIGFEYDNAWNTQQFGAKLSKALAGTAPQAAPKPQAASKTQADKELEKQVEGSAADIAGARVRVYGKAQNRTALGIVHAYMVMYPQATLEDLKKAFPNALNPDCGTKEIFKTKAELEKQMEGSTWNGYFSEEECLLPVKDGKVLVVSMWTKPSFERLVAWAKQYGIVVADFESVGKGGQKGGFRLEYLNGYIPPKPKKGVPVWVWAIVASVILGLLAMLLFGNKKTVEKVVTETVVVHDTLYVQQIEEIEKNYNAAEFVAGKAELGDDVRFVLHDLAKVMQKNPQLKLRLEGHTSAEGDAAFNQKLSEARAQAAVTFLVEHEGIDASRLEAIGYGSSRLKNEADPTAPENRRTEFVVVE